LDFGILSAFGFRHSDFMTPNRRISFMKIAGPDGLEIDKSLVDRLHLDDFL